MSEEIDICMILFEGSMTNSQKFWTYRNNEILGKIKKQDTLRMIMLRRIKRKRKYRRIIK